MFLFLYTKDCFSYNFKINLIKHRKKVGEMEQVTGIEPALKAWEALILPLNYTCTMR